MTMLKYLAGLTAGAGLALTAAGAAAEAPCATFEVQPSHLVVSYNPFQNPNVNEPANIRVNRRDNSIKEVRFILVEATPNGARSRVGLAGPQDYYLELNANASQPVFYIGSAMLTLSNGAVAEFNGGSGNAQVQFKLRIPAGQPVAAAEQVDPLEIHYQCYGDGGVPIGSEEIQYDSRVQIVINTSPVFGAYLGGQMGSNTGQIDFGPLDPQGGDPTRNLSVTTQSVGSYSIRVQTERGQHLRTSQTATTGIPYTMRLGSYAVSDNTVLRCVRTPAPSGSTRSLAVTLDNSVTASLPAGRYNDTITLTFTPNDGLAGEAGDTCTGANP